MYPQPSAGVDGHIGDPLIVGHVGFAALLEVDDAYARREVVVLVAHDHIAA